MNTALQLENDLKLKELYPRFAANVEDFLNKAIRLGYSVGIFSGLRKWEEQERLYAQGRTEPGKIVTNSRPGYSWHNYGTAVDIVWRDPYGNWTWNEPNEGDWKKLVEISKDFKLHSGSAWGDWPHFERNLGRTLEECKQAYERGGLKEVWRLFDVS